MIVTNKTRNIILCPQAELADSFFMRMRGLLGRTALPQGHGLVITHCNSVHMFFMKFPIDVMFLDRGGRVVGMEHALQPGRLSRIYWSADRAVELPAGTLTRFSVANGDLIELHNNS